jgi:hypothetical protein
MKAKTDFAAQRYETDTEIIQRQVQLAEDMLDSLQVMGDSQRAFFAWEEDPILGPSADGKPQRRQPPPRITTPEPEETQPAEPSQDKGEF